LTGVSPSTHIQPPGCIIEANLEYLAKYETRRPWLNYGACAYFGEGEDGGKKLPKLIGIWVCYCKTLVCPGEDMWSHAKAVLRTSLCCSLTLRDHLSYTHWVVANGLGISARTELTPDHILRRLLKQFYFGTADINVASKQILLPVNGLAHRLFGFSEQAWPTYFGDVLAEWHWRPFPETLMITIALTGLRQSPLLSDWTQLFRGLQDSWGAIRHQKVIDLVRRFQVDLIVCAEEIDGLN
jgi:hypothetical protein